MPSAMRPLLMLTLLAAAGLAAGNGLAKEVKPQKVERLNLPSVLRAPSGFAPAPPPTPQAAPASESKEPEGTVEKCIPVDYIRETDVKDDHTIRFKMRGGATYIVTLRDKCFGLAFHESFYYQAGPTRQLCSGYDSIIARSGSHCRIDTITRINRKPDARK